MTRHLLITIDAGETTCDGCDKLHEDYGMWQHHCVVWGKGLDARSQTIDRLPECLDSERRAKDNADVCTLHAIRNGGAV